VLSSTNARLAAARRLTSRKERRETGRFLVEGTQAVREALAAGAVLELFATTEALARNAELLTSAAGIALDEVSVKDAAALSDTVTPQGLVAVCRLRQPAVDDVLGARPKLIAMLVEPNEPGNLGAIIRTADAAGAAAVVLDGGTDPYNPKTVRASAGSLFHLPIVSCATEELLARAADAGMQSLATSGYGSVDLDTLADTGALAQPTLWLFGSEAHGLPATVLASADQQVSIPIHGRAESLNLAAAAAVCLYASARAQRA
jgi:TrmH family RNA methyltransferase